MIKILLCSRGDYPASKKIFSALSKHFGSDAVLWAENSEKMKKILDSERPNWVVFPFWSWLIPLEIIESYKCISFHSGDLPKDRGGSPIQNQVMSGKKSTVLTAFKTSKEMDAGPIYLKQTLSLTGDLATIHRRIALAIPKMVIKIIDKGLIPYPQTGEPTYFKRRVQDQSEIKPSEMTAEQIYNLIRCLNMEPYPFAFIRGKDGKRVFILKAKLEK